MKLPTDKRFVFVAFWAAVAILVAISIGTHQSTIHLVATGGRIEHTRQLSDGLQQVLFGLQEADVGARGFIRTADPSYLRQREAAVKQIQEALRKLYELIGDEGLQKGDLDSLWVLTDSYRALHDTAIKLGRDNGADAGLQLLDAERSRSVSDQIRTSVERMQDTERRLLLLRDEELRRRADINIALFVIGSCFSLAIFLGVFLYLHTQVTARELAERALTAEKRSLEERVQQRTAALSLTNEQLLHEIHDHQLAEQAARESEQKYRDLIEGAYDMIQSVSPAGQILSVNRAWLTTLGYTEADLPRLSVYDIIHPESHPHCRQVFARLLAGESVTNLEVTFLTKDGRAIPVEGNATALRRDGAVVATHGFFRDVSERKRAEQALHELSGRLLQLQDEERRRIARALHDVTAQNLSAITLDLARLEKMIPGTDEKIRKVLTESLALGEESLRDIRTLSYLLHPPMLDESGLAVALEWYLDGFSKRSGLRVNLAAPPDLGRLPAEVETALFRVVQESLTNIHRHSGSKTATVQFTRDTATVTLAVTDEGRGMPRSGPGGGALGVGIRGMRERLHQLGGWLVIDSSQRGTTVRAVLPLGGENHDTHHAG